MKNAKIAFVCFFKKKYEYLWKEKQNQILQETKFQSYENTMLYNL